MYAPAPCSLSSPGHEHPAATASGDPGFAGASGGVALRTILRMRLDSFGMEDMVQRARNLSSVKRSRRSGRAGIYQNLIVGTGRAYAPARTPTTSHAIRGSSKRGPLDSPAAPDGIRLIPYPRFGPAGRPLHCDHAYPNFGDFRPPQFVQSFGPRWTTASGRTSCRFHFFEKSVSEVFAYRYFSEYHCDGGCPRSADALG